MIGKSRNVEDAISLSGSVSVSFCEARNLVLLLVVFEWPQRPRYLARYFTGEEAASIAAVGEGSGFNLQAGNIAAPFIGLMDQTAVDLAETNSSPYYSGQSSMTA